MKGFALVAATLSMLAAVVLGTTTVASAAGKYKCNGVTNIVTCNDAVDKAVVKITGNRALTTLELSVLTNNLNKATANVAVIENVVVKTYKSFNPSINITVGDVYVCVASICG